MTSAQNPLHAAAGALTLFLLCAVPCAQAQAQQDIVGPPPLVRENAAVRVGMEQIKLPGNEKMGMLGTSYLLEIAPSLYFGPAVYGAITGQRGGFYTGGGELAWGRKLYSDLMLVTGVYVGGGGGGAAAVGGGLMLRPHVDLMWNFGGARAGISVSHVRFPNGSISSNQVGFMLDFGTEYRHTDFEQRGQHWSITERTGVGFDRALLFGGTYQPRSGSTNVSGVPLKASIGYVGARMERFVTPKLYWGLEATGAVSGGAGGYAEFLGTVGAEMPLWDDRMAIGTRVALGMGGGGTVKVGGGLLVKAGAYATAKLSRDLHLSLEGGIAASPDGNFRAPYSTLALHWNLDHPNRSATTSRIIGNEWVAGTQRYMKAARQDGRKQDMDSLTIKLNRFVTESIYLTGQAHSAYSGGAGGYSAGLVGLGYRTPKTSFGLSAGAELLAGAGAGGGVASSGGAIVQPMAYLSLDLSKSVSARLGVGRIKSLQGDLNSNLVDVGLSFSFGAGSRN